MHRLVLIALAGLTLAFPGLAQAADDPVAGAWVVHGKVETFAFVVNCVFERHGERFGGVCIDVGSGKRHPLTAGTVSGDRVSFTYGSNFLLTKFDVVYAGALQGGTIRGTVQVPGHNGVFTATRR
jgi:hypothetical protein